MHSHPGAHLTEVYNDKGWAKTEAESWGLSIVSYMAGSNAGTWAVLLLSKVCISKKLESESRLISNLGTLLWDMGNFTNVLTMGSDDQPLVIKILEPISKSTLSTRYFSSFRRMDILFRVFPIS